MYITKDDRITPNQAMISIPNSTLGAGLLIMPRVLLQEVGTAEAWITLLLGGLMTLVAMIVMIKLSQNFPKQTLFQYVSAIVGKPIGNIICLLFCIYFLMTASYELRVLGEVLIFYLLEGTPEWAIIIPLMLVSYYLLLGGVNSLMRLFQIVFPFTIVFILITYSLSFTLFDINNFRPFLSDGVTPIFRGLTSSFNSFAAFELAAVYIAYMTEPKKAAKAFGLGLTLVIFIYVLSIVLVIGSLSLEAGMLSTWSTIDLMRNYELKGFIFERIEILFLTIWVMQIFCTFSSMYFGASSALAQVVQYKKHPVMLGLLPICYILTMMPRNINDITDLGDLISYYTISLFAIFLVLYLIYFIKKKVSANA